MALCELTNCVNNAFMTVAEHIKASGKTNQEIAKEVGVSSSLIAMIAIGQRRVSDRLLPGLSAALGVSPRELRPDLATLFDADSGAKEK